MSSESYYIILGIGMCAFSITMNFIFLKFLKTLGTKNQSDGVMIRWSEQAKPAIGGISFFIVFLASLIVGLFWTDVTWLSNRQLVGLTLACTLAFVSGLYDDAFNTQPMVKLGSQITTALILLFFGFVIELTSMNWLNYALTIFWIVGMMNSLNMLDNMDGITCLTSIMILLLGTVLMISGGLWDVPLLTLTIAMLAALFGFLVFNWHPSKMFMGDSGSQFLGTFLAVIGIIIFWNGNINLSFDISQLNSIVLAGLVFLIPIADTTVVTINRISHGRSPFVGGRDHTTHNFSYLGLKDNQIAFIYVGFGVINTLLALWLIRFNMSKPGLTIIVGGAYILVVILSLFVLSRRNLSRNKFSYS